MKIQAKLTTSTSFLFKSIYLKILRFCLKFRYLFSSISLVVFAGCLYFAKQNMKFILFPAEGVEVFFLRAQLEDGASKDETLKKFKYLENIIGKEISSKELIAYVSHIGLHQNDNMDPLTVRGSHLGQIGVYLTPESKRQRTAQQIIDFCMFSKSCSLEK